MALSANAIPRDIENGLLAGFFRYLTKPIKVNEFMEALDVALQSTSRRQNADSAESLMQPYNHWTIFQVAAGHANQFGDQLVVRFAAPPRAFVESVFP